MKKKALSLCLVFSLAAALLIGCGSEPDGTQPECPFSELKWTSSVQDMEAVEGTAYETYDSVYGGTTYTYPKDYKNVTGTVKYMFDDKDRLSGIAWAYGSENESELYTLYFSIHGDLVESYGSSGYNTEKESNYGDVWYRKEGNIIISTMITNSQKALQFAFVSPDHSTAEKDRHKSTLPDPIK